MSKEKTSTGMVHKLPTDFKKAIASDPKVQKLWDDITPLARNEWICWVISPKTLETRDRHIKVGLDKMRKGMRRPCCWSGCHHRKGKSLSPSQRFVLSKKTKK
jgi:uncharacterized protein YdeI (YjbR/CyaY-like superfamily)